MKIIKFLFNKTILINYFIVIILPIAFSSIILSLENNMPFNFEHIIWRYNSANSFGIWILSMLKSGFERNIYIDTIYILIFKYIFVLIYVKLIGENNKKTLITISIIISIVGSFLGYIIFALFTLT